MNFPSGNPLSIFNGEPTDSELERKRKEREGGRSGRGQGSVRGGSGIVVMGGKEERGGGRIFFFFLCQCMFLCWLKCLPTVGNCWPREMFMTGYPVTTRIHLKNSLLDNFNKSRSTKFLESNIFLFAQGVKCSVLILFFNFYQYDLHWFRKHFFVCHKERWMRKKIFVNYCLCLAMFFKTGWGLY